MKPFFWALLVLLLAGGTAAADTTYGPYLDCDQYVGVAGVDTPLFLLEFIPGR